MSFLSADSGRYHLKSRFGFTSDNRAPLGPQHAAFSAACTRWFHEPWNLVGALQIVQKGHNMRRTLRVFFAFWCQLLHAFEPFVVGEHLQGRQLYQGRRVFWLPFCFRQNHFASFLEYSAACVRDVSFASSDFWLAYVPRSF